MYNSTIGRIERRYHYNEARAKHGDNRYAIKNSLKKHHYYSEAEAWAIIDEFSKPDSGVTLGDILNEALKYKNEKNYVVTNLDGDVVLTGKSADDFVMNADKLGIPRSSYRLFVEVVN